MKVSDAILKGCTIRPRKIKGAIHSKDGRGSCVYGAALDGLSAPGVYGDYHFGRVASADAAFLRAYGCGLVTMNDSSDTRREEIAGMLQAIRR